MDFDPSRWFGVSGVLKSERLLFYICFMFDYHIPLKGVLLFLRDSLVRTRLQSDVVPVDGDDHMTYFTGIAFAMRKHHSTIVRDRTHKVHILQK